MSTTTTLNIRGLDELNKFLEQLPGKLQLNIMRGALRAGQKPILDDARNSVAVGHSGNLKNALRLTTKINRKNGSVESYLKVGGKHKGKDAFYAHMVEYGTKEHEIKPRTRAGMLINGTRIYTAVIHPGARERPFMRPALDRNAAAAIIATGNYIKNRLQNKEGIDTSHIFVEGDE